MEKNRETAFGGEQRKMEGHGTKHTSDLGSRRPWPGRGRVFFILKNSERVRISPQHTSEDSYLAVEYIFPSAATKAATVQENAFYALRWPLRGHAVLYTGSSSG